MQPEASAIGRRSLAVTALAYLAKIEQVDTILEASLTMHRT